MTAVRTTVAAIEMRAMVLTASTTLSLVGRGGGWVDEDHPVAEGQRHEPDHDHGDVDRGVRRDPEPRPARPEQVHDRGHEREHEDRDRRHVYVLPPRSGLEEPDLFRHADLQGDGQDDRDDADLQDRRRKADGPR